MSIHYYLAIPTVTATLRHILTNGLLADLGEAIEVDSRPPDVIGREAPINRLNVFLYSVGPNISYQNVDLPTRARDGTLISTPKLGLNLHYLFSAYGSENKDVRAQRILASAMMIMKENPIITRQMIDEAKKNSEYEIANSELADQVEHISITWQNMTVEDMTKLWSTFFQTNYRISVAYQVTVVLLERKLPPRPVQLVQERVVNVFSLRQQPVIIRIEPMIWGQKPINEALAVELRGMNLKADGTTEVHFGEEASVTPNSKDIGNDRIFVTIPNNLPVGSYEIWVSHQNASSPSSDIRSNVVTFLLASKITSPREASVAQGSNLEIEFQPVILRSQRVELLLGVFRLPVPMPAEPEGDDPVNKLSILIPGDFPVGTYTVRLQVDNLVSFVSKDSDPTSPTFNRDIPSVTIIAG
jgi:hypothetical protein